MAAQLTARRVVRSTDREFFEGQAAIAASSDPTGAGTSPCILPRRPDQTSVRELSVIARRR